MCGRFRLSRRKQIIEEHFDTVSGEEDWIPRYNVAPTQPVSIIRQHPKEPHRELALVRWGLVPWWAKDTSIAAKMINARSETAATLPAFRDACSNLAGVSSRLTVFTSGGAPGRRNSRIASRLTAVSCSRSPDSGIVGKIQTGTGLRPARFSPPHQTV